MVQVLLLRLFRNILYLYKVKEYRAETKKSFLEVCSQHNDVMVQSTDTCFTKHVEMIFICLQDFSRILLHKSSIIGSNSSTALLSSFCHQSNLFQKFNLFNVVLCAVLTIKTVYNKFMQILYRKLKNINK